jgi:hypothetical protein
MENDIRRFSIYFILLINILFNQCSNKQNTAPKAKKVSLQTSLVDYSSNYKQKLSEYNFYKGELADLIPNENVFPYMLNTPLFTNNGLSSSPKAKK